MKKKYKFWIVGISILGALIMIYLTNLHFSGAEDVFCNLGEGFSCDVVNKSIYSDLFGVPMAVLGLLYFLAVIVAVLWKYQIKTLQGIIFFSVALLGPSIYLTGIEIFVLENICVFCELSKLLMVGNIIVAWRALRSKHVEELMLIWATILALVLIAITHLLFSFSGPTDEYNEFAQCLDEKGYLMYGSVTCAFCERQRRLFGDAFEFIEEVECDPRNENNQAQLCIDKNVERTPTWMREDSDGNELHRFEPGVVSLEDLSEHSACPLPELNA